MTTWKPIGIKSAAHSSDVKACARVDGDKVVTAGRDGVVRLWQFAGGECEELLSYEEHEGFVNSVAFIPATSEYPQGIIASGGKDKLINLWDYAGKRLCGTLIGHEDNICKLSVFSAEAAPFVLASSSWDGSVRCWSEELSPASCIVLRAASGPCWSCASLGKDVFVTGHADKSLRIWRGDRQVQVIANAHRDVVRDVVAVDHACFLSVGNDGALKVWDSTSGTAVQTVDCAHPAFIYGLSWNGNDRIVSFGEEGIVKVWKWLASERRIEEDSVLRVPITSAWCATFLDERTLLVGGSTGSLYIFSSLKSHDSRNIENAFLSELSAFDAQVHASKSCELEKNAQNESVLKYPGEREGKTILVRRPTGVIEAHQWDGAEWKYLGEAVDPMAVKAPDFNFKVDLDDSGKTYNLAYSYGENPYSVAKNFLERNDIPISYLDEVANFIVKNAGVTSSADYDETLIEDAVIKEPGNLVIEAYNAEGVLGKLRAFGMQIDGDVTIEEMAETLKTWPVAKLFPCLDWLRVQILKGAEYDRLLSVVPYEKILDEGTRDVAAKECVAAVTMALRLLCNAANKGAELNVDLAKVIGKCSQSISSNNTTWIPLLIGLLYNKRTELDCTKSMALLHGLLAKIRTMLAEAEIARIYWLIKGAERGGSVPLASAIKKEIEGKSELQCLMQLLK